MKYFTKEWYRAALAEEQQRAAGGKLKFNKKAGQRHAGLSAGAV